MQKTIFTCAACGCQAEDNFELGEPFPVGWHNRRIDAHGNLNPAWGGKTYLLCHRCGDEAHFYGGMSPSLRARFARRGIQFDAVCALQREE